MVKQQIYVDYLIMGLVNSPQTPHCLLLQLTQGLKSTLKEMI